MPRYTGIDGFSYVGECMMPISRCCSVYLLSPLCKPTGLTLAEQGCFRL